MWLHLTEKKMIINLDHVRRIYAEPWGQGSHILIGYADDGQPFEAKDFKGAQDAESVLTRVTGALEGGTKVYPI